MASPPEARISPAPFSISAAVRAARTTCAPSAARAAAIAFPIPLPAPVTTATVPESLFALIDVLLQFQFLDNLVQLVEA